MNGIFNGIKFDDVYERHDPELNDWSQVCNDCVTKHNIDEKKLDDAGQGICGVEGCSNESGYYIDFADGELIKE